MACAEPLDHSMLPPGPTTPPPASAPPDGSASRTPATQAAAHARTFPPAPAQTRRSQATQSAANSKASRKIVVRTCPGCGAQWCPLPGGYTRKTCRAPECIRALASQATLDHARRHAMTVRPLTDQERHRLRTMTGPLLKDLVNRFKSDDGICRERSPRRWASAKLACHASLPGTVCRAPTTPAPQRQTVLQNRRACLTTVSPAGWARGPSGRNRPAVGRVRGDGAAVLAPGRPPRALRPRAVSRVRHSAPAAGHVGQDQLLGT